MIMYKHILIPTDGSPLSEEAVRQGMALAKSLGARGVRNCERKRWRQRLGQNRTR